VELSFVGDVCNPELEDVPMLDRVWLRSLFEDGPHASISANAAMAIADMNNFAMSAPDAQRWLGHHSNPCTGRRSGRSRRRRESACAAGG
jgi:hypothetical protein